MNAVVLCVHQIDAAYWHEWNLFRLPGGNQLNLILNLLIIASVFYAYRHVLSGSPTWRRGHAYLAFLGLLTLSLHSLFFYMGHEEFLQPMSLALIAATALLSLAQIVLLRKTLPA